MKLEEKTVKKNYIYHGRIINVRNDDAELPNGKPCRREVVEHPGGVCIAALTEDNELLFVRQASLKRERIHLKRASVSLRRKPVALPTSIMILASFTRHPDIAAKSFISMPQRA